jgi:ABC-type sugar transport system ATPase subunit
MSAIRFTNVGKRFGRVAALAGLNLDIATGEFISLLGPSGSGKTTTLNLLAGLLAADEGEIRIGERVVNDVPADKRDIAMVFQNYALYPHMTVHENIAFPLRARGRAWAEARIEEAVARVAKTLGIAELLARYPKELSGGQQQRVALGRAMVRDPKVFLLDEPLSNLDARLRLRMRRDLKALHEALGATIVYVTHDQAEAMTLSTRVAIFNQGRLQQFDTPENIYSRPANVFVANFVGDREINLLHGSLDGTEIRAGNNSIVLPLDRSQPRPRMPADGKVVIGVRAEGILPVETAGTGDVAAIVASTERLGAELVVFASTADGTELCCRAHPDGRFAKGQAIGLRFLPEHIHLFDAASQESLRLPSSR